MAAPIRQAIGLDFGTTNTVAAIVNACDNAETIQFGDGNEAISTFRSVVSFWREHDGGSVRMEGGPWAIEHFIEFPSETRFLQSFKTFAGSPLFDTTGIFGKHCACLGTGGRRLLLCAAIDEKRQRPGL